MHVAEERFIFRQRVLFLVSTRIMSSPPRHPRGCHFFRFTRIFLLAFPGACHAAELQASDRAANDYFGYDVSLSGSVGFVSSYWDDDKGNDSGSAYIFRDLGTASGVLTQNAKLVASDGAVDDRFGTSVSLSGNIGLVGAIHDDDRGGDSGSAYLFRGLSTATGIVQQQAKLLASDGAAADFFGSSVSLSGTTGLVGARWDNGVASSSGSAYVFQGLDTASGTTYQNMKLTASDAAANDNFGAALSLSGIVGLIGAWGDDGNAGAAYVFRGLNEPGVASKTESRKLTASDRAAGDQFGHSVSLSGSIALVGAYMDDDAAINSGSAYIFRGVTNSGPATEDLKLVASDGDLQDWFGYSVSLSGGTGLVGAYSDDDKGSNSGSVYLFRNLSSATGTIHQDVKITASSGLANDFFGYSVAIDGDQFLIGARGRSGSGSAFTGSAAAMTKLDDGNTSKLISGLSFTSKDDWIIGQKADANRVTLSAGDTANITASGMAVRIGRDAGSNDNQLTLQGHVMANAVHIGAAGNSGNSVLLGSGGTVATTAGVHVAAGSSLVGNGTVSGNLAVVGALSPGATGALKVQNGNVSLAAGSLFNWQLASNTETGAGAHYGGLQVSTGNLTISSDAAFRVILSGTANLAADFWQQDRAWTDIFKVTGGNITSGWTGKSVAVYLENGTSPVSTARGKFEITDTTLTWTAVPEPSSFLAGLLMSAGLLRRNRER